MADRLTEILDLAEMQGLDLLALVPGPNLFYATGLHFMLSERPVVLLLPVDDEPAMVLPEFEAEKATAAGYYAFSYTDEEGYALAFHEACAALELADARIGVESLRMRVLEEHILQRYAPGAVLVHADDLLSELRSLKSAEELAAMRQAIAVAEDAFLSWLPDLHVGMTEREAAARLVAALLRSGAEGLPFEPIVAGGPNGGLPHAVPGTRPFAPGDWVVVDWGAYVGRYASDVTRAVVFGDPQAAQGGGGATGDLLAVHEVVLRANGAGRAAVRPGVSAQAVDTAARNVTRAAGYGDYFLHRTGHGLGLEAHEPPYIVQGNRAPLEAGMVFTVEPGIYLAGVGGVRLEDDVVVTATGCETLTTLSRAPFIIHP